jgi:drug/metabolite transporter (DMT)-like permease
MSLPQGVPQGREPPGAHAAIGLVAMAVASFAALDTATQFVVAAAQVVMVLWFRALFQIVLMLALEVPRQGWGFLRTRHPVLQTVRGVLMVSCSLLAFLSLAFMPVGEFTAVVLLTPLLLTELAARGLGERVGLWCWLCVLLGFAGAMVVIRPGGAMFQPALLLPLLLVAANAGFHLVSRRLAMVEGVRTVHAWTGLVGLALMSVALPFWWVSLPWGTWAVLLFIGASGTLGHLLLIKAYAVAPVASVTPYLYLQIAFATLFGWIVFAQAPDGWSWLGIGLIAVSGTLGTWLAAREEAAAAR